MTTTIPTSNLTRIPPNPSGTRRQLLTPLPEPGHFLLVLDNSSAEKFTTCPEAARNYLVLGREGQAKSVALINGGATHVGLEAFLQQQYLHQTCGPDGPGDHPYDAAAQDAAIVKFWTDNPVPTQFSDDYRNVNSCLEVMRHYRFDAELPDKQWTILADADGPIIERAFELPLGVLEVGAYIEMPWLTKEQEANCQWGWNSGEDNSTTAKVWCSHIQVAWSGRIDAITHYRGLARVVDHKTASDKRYLNSQEYHLANQTIGYVWAAKQLWPDLDVSGFCLNAIIFKKPTGSGSIIDRGPRGGDPALTFERYTYQYSDERLLWWQNNALTIVEDFVHCLVRNHFPSHTKWCYGKYGPCPYVEVCEQDSAQMRDALIMSDRYKTVTWNPTADR